jgi:hypothetical protein
MAIDRPVGGDGAPLTVADQGEPHCDPLHFSPGVQCVGPFALSDAIPHPRLQDHQAAQPSPSKRSSISFNNTPKLRASL